MTPLAVCPEYSMVDAERCHECPAIAAVLETCGLDPTEPYGLLHATVNGRRITLFVEVDIVEMLDEAQRLNVTPPEIASHVVREAHLGWPEDWIAASGRDGEERSS